MTQTWSQMRQAIKEHLESISSVGKVNDYRRHHIDWTRIAENYVDNNKIVFSQ